eukprot:CAMPEP_0184294044 /NCGR_PEP_ID=MMETSP1049-20130417/5332_1 /TAXON_ID=77928 /ORGANISM="Proteomonas sulcata, Strain CCMP704" /LENGTH=161 /DNA_ID=CAMNT_0026602203 /DNA_START=205 /DNA_END=690 /DNA_ORIENTATION=-
MIEVRDLKDALDVKGPKWKPKTNMNEEVRFVMSQLDRVQRQFQYLAQSQVEDERKFNELGIPFDKMELKKIKLLAISAAKYVMGIALNADSRLSEAQASGSTSVKVLAQAVGQVKSLLESALRFGFKVHQFAEGFDKEAAGKFHQVKTSLDRISQQSAGAK